MKNESGFVCVVADYDMADKIRAISDVVFRLIQKAVTDNYQGKFNYSKTKKGRFFKTQEIQLFDGDKFEREFHALVDPIRFCYVSRNNRDLWAGCPEYHILKTGSCFTLWEIIDLIVAPMCKLYLTPSQASLWKKIQAADINLYLEATK